MREIKFRAWDTERKKFVTPEDAEEAYINWENNYLVKHCTLTLMQYTGLKDSKRTKEYPEGQEIYEGDICELDGGGERTSKMKVGFENGCFVVYPDWLKEKKAIELKWYTDWREEIMTIEVIGNIYENKEEEE
jgi:uncharacterized phage protein (TIGR01671 family)